MLSYNTAIVLAGVGLLGAVSGIVGSFAVLRGRALTGDALAHAALPGICVGFLVAGERGLFPLLLGAFLSGLLGIAVISALRHYTRVKEDAAIGIVLSVFFGAGIVLSRLIQNRVTSGSKAGLDSYILGKTAGMIAQDVLFIGGVALVCLVCIAWLYKEFQLVIFDPGFARVQGWPVLVLDLVLMALLAVTVVIGLPAVGVVLMAAMLILPAAAARFWTDRLGLMLALAGVFGALVGVLGTLLSARYALLPAGPMIVLAGTGLFLVSLFFAPRRGLLARQWQHWLFQRSLDERRFFWRLHQHLREQLDGTFTVEQLISPAWTTLNLSKSLRRAQRQGLVKKETPSARSTATTTVWNLTPRGQQRVVGVARGQYLWRAYLTEYPDQAGALVDLSRETVADLLSAEVLTRLIVQLRANGNWPREATT